MDVPVAQASRDGFAVPAGVTGAELFVQSNDGNVVVRAVNPGAASYVDVYPAATFGGMTLAAHRVACPSGETWLGPWPPAVFNAADGSVRIVPGDPSIALSGLGI